VGAGGLVGTGVWVGTGVGAATGSIVVAAAVQAVTNNINKIANRKK